MSETQFLFTPDSATGQILLAWWQGLNDDRASRANLKRCSTPLEVVMTSAYQRLYSRLQTAGLPEQQPDSDRLPAVVGILAHIKKDNADVDFAARCSGIEKEPVVHPLRFKHLLESSDTAELFTNLRRILSLIDDTAPVLVLSRDIYFWGDKTKRRWVYGYKWPS